MKSSKKVVSVVGNLLMVASFAFIVRQVMRHDVDFSILTSPIVITGLLLTGLAVGFGILLAGLNFSWLIRNITGSLVQRRLVIRVYCTSNMYKYLPGSVMYLLGRNRIAFESKEVSHAQVAFATAMEGLFVFSAAIILIGLFVSEQAVFYISQVRIPSFVWIIAGAVAVIGAILSVIFRQRLRVGLQKFVESMRNFSPLAKVKRLATFLLILLVLGLTYLATLMLFGQEITLGMVPTVIGLYLLAWVAGFLTPGASGGMGVCEVVLIMFLGNYLSTAIVLSSAIMHRLVTIVGDVCAYGMVMAYKAKTGK